MQFVRFTLDFTLAQSNAVCESHISKGISSIAGIDFGNIVATVFFQFVRCDEQRVTDTESFEVTARLTGGVLDLDGDTRHRGLARRQDNVFEIHIAVGASQVLKFKTDNTYALNKTLTVSVQCVEGINCIVSCAVSRRVIQDEKRIELFEGRLRCCSLHLLRLVHYDYRAVRCNHIDRTARSKLVTLRVDDTALLRASSLFEGGGKRLSVYKHHIQTGILRELVELIEIRAVIDEPTCFLSILLHEVFLQHTERLCHTLTYGNTWHNYNELGPAVEFVKLKHRLNIDVGLSRAGFHLDIEVDGTESVNLGQRFGKRYTCQSLNGMEVFKQLLGRKFHVSITVAVII
ncbi:hypothetical protein IMSAG025_02255 [Muribaculaceae bacterium]|nr:hypothetical protein IMSAG025_02255 [Muribaculaceae bacterium]